MKFVHLADIHLDMPFKIIGQHGEKRRIEQLDILRKVSEYIKENDIKYMFLAGDLYEHEYVKDGTINALINIFKKIPETNIFISPGNHDPFIVKSIYDRYEFPSNVHVFEGIQMIETEEFNIYGYGFTDFYDKGIDLEKIKILENGKKNIFVVHGDIDGLGGSNEQGKEYNPLSSEELIKKGFDYVAAGHVHDYISFGDGKIVYPGAMMNYNFKGHKSGMIVGEFIKEKQMNSDGMYEVEVLKTNHIDLDEVKYEIVELDVSGIKTQEEIVTKINFMNLDKRNFIKIELKGNRETVINTKYILDNLLTSNIVRVEDKTNLAYDLEEIAKENTLRGIFTKKALQKIEKVREEEKEIFQKAIEIVIEEMR